ncbi:MAG: hypothetical protein EPO06_05705 [Burkholderiaceae bacterium]|nr:MAG: hypothetical protein EPO06_05705 [Burkholderiaceae bacterium]
MLKAAFNFLPPDHFGVHVENEMDERQLLWLANVIGEEKLRASANKRNKYYPDSKLFVSVILKRFQLKVPAKIYAAVNIPVYWVYVLVLRDHSAIKVGMTGRWPGRAYDFVKTADYSKNFDDKVKNLFDVNRSLAWRSVSESDARFIERSIKQTHSEFSVPSPYHRGLISFGCGGHKEWFAYSIYEQLLNSLSENRTSASLDASMAWQGLMGST